MRKSQKKQAEEFLNVIDEAHEEVKSFLNDKKYDLARALLGQCQDCGYSLYDFIIDLEGEEHSTLNDVNEYCNLVFDIHNEIADNENISINNTIKRLKKALVKIENSIKNNVEVKSLIVFLPYKASMWDSMESVWIAANEDPRCEAYVVPIPYYDRNPDWTLNNYYYEGNSLPSYVPILDYKSFNLEELKPDIIYIHNPYDGENFVTSVDPMYYSYKLKEQTELLIYIPYFSNSGRMGNVGSICSSYFHVDNIIIQSEGVRGFFDSRVPSEKLVALGTPKFDRVLSICNNKSEITEDWERKIEGRKVYFYNTSIGGMLKDTEKFLYKMMYVFNTFLGRDDICLLWRPHPLLESTFTSMRSNYLEKFNEIKNFFHENNLGIYDDTPDIEKAIEVSDVYIGDAGTSVTSLFGIAGKPIFILDNDITELPRDDDYICSAITGIPYIGSNKLYTVNGKDLYYSENDDYDFKHYVSLSERGSSDIYHRGVEVNGKIFVTPILGNQVLVYENNKLIKKIELKNFAGKLDDKGLAISLGDNIYIIPHNYPAIVCLNTKNYKVNYIEGYNELFRNQKNGEWVFGGINIWDKFMILSSPIDDRFMFIDNETLKVQIVRIGIENSTGFTTILPKDSDIWCLPSGEGSIVKWNPITSEYKEYKNYPENFEFDNILKDRAFLNGVFSNDKLIIAPFNSNMFVSLDTNTGEMREWETPFDSKDETKSSYVKSKHKYVFLDNSVDGIAKICDMKKMKIYELNVTTKEYTEKSINFDKEEIIKNEIGFGNAIRGLAYSCKESAINTLKDFIDGNISGDSFNKDKQLEEFRKIAANSDGTCGEKIHEFAMKKQSGIK